MDTYTSAHV
uniref:Uncharacterized protein n=1 Tax=Anguilla anguilla TaxID=7936 RepID=A0A0E9QG65_ANGAN